MVRVAERARRHVPRLVEVQPLLVDEDAHQLRHRQRGMRVVELDRDLLGETVEHAEAERPVEQLVALLVAPDDVLEGRRHEEVLLRQAQRLALAEVVVRVEDSADVLRARPTQDRADVVAAVELVEVELAHRAGAPEAQRVDGLRPVARDRRVVRRRQHVVRVDPFVHRPARSRRPTPRPGRRSGRGTGTRGARSPTGSRT